MLCVVCSFEELSRASQVVMTIPEGFELEPVKAGSHPVPDVPSQQKTDIYDDADSYFGTTDERAIEVIYMAAKSGSETLICFAKL